MMFLTLYLLIGLCISLIESPTRPSIDLALLWPLALVAIFSSVVLWEAEVRA
jgi:hypothetical protein